MIAAYYDQNGYPDIYTGPTNGSVMPITDTSWEPGPMVMLPIPITRWLHQKMGWTDALARLN